MDVMPEKEHGQEGHQFGQITHTHTAKCHLSGLINYHETRHKADPGGSALLLCYSADRQV